MWVVVVGVEGEEGGGYEKEVEEGEEDEDLVKKERK